MADEMEQRTGDKNGVKKKPAFKRRDKKTNALLLTSAVVMLFIIGVATAYDYGYSMCKSHEQPTIKVEKPMIVLSGRAPQIVIPKGFNYSFYVKTDFGAIGVFANEKNTLREMMGTTGMTISKTANLTRVKVVLPPVYNYKLVNGSDVELNQTVMLVSFNKDDLYHDVILKANGTLIKMEVIKSISIGNNTEK